MLGLTALLEELPRERTSLLDNLGRIRRQVGPISPELSDAVADHMNIRRGEVDEVVSFYSYLRVPLETPRVCTGPVCDCFGARPAAGELAVPCLGHCDLAPDSEYPFVLSTGRTLYHYNSATMTLREAGVTQKQEEPFVELHLEDGAALGIADGDMVRLVSRRGQLEAKALYSERVYPGLVWMALHFAEAKVNLLRHDVGDPLIGTPEYKVSAVRVERL